MLLVFALLIATQAGADELVNDCEAVYVIIDKGG